MIAFFCQIRKGLRGGRLGRLRASEGAGILNGFSILDGLALGGRLIAAGFTSM